MARNWFWVWPYYLYTVDFDWLTAHNYGVCLFTDPSDVSAYDSPAAFDAYFDGYFELCVENDLPVQLIINDLSYTGNRSTPTGTYETNFGAAISHAESKWGPSGTNGQVLEQYWYEGGYDNFATWLRGKTALKIACAIFYECWVNAGGVGPQSYIGNGSETKESALTRRVGLSNEICLELWCVWDAVYWDLRGCAKYVRDNFPSKTLSINTLPTASPAGGCNDDTGYWTIEYSQTAAQRIANNDPLPSYQESINRFHQAMRDVINYVGPIDSIQAQPQPWDNSGVYQTGLNYWPWNKTQLEMFDALPLTSPSKLVYTMSQQGISPYYLGAGWCGVTPTLTDTFANTGNEIIMLKSTSSSSHTITVTGTHETENYTITISPTTPTFLGPYPIAEFGALPTITYDNSNLYVSIVKDIPV